MQEARLCRLQFAQRFFGGIPCPRISASARFLSVMSL
jgi:hypothetical protein